MTESVTLAVDADLLVSIPSLARQRRLHRTTMFRQLLVMHANDLQYGRGGWLVRLGPRKKLRVNVTMLRREHPEFFPQGDYVRRSDIVELENRLERVESAQAHNNKRQNAIAASVRDLKKEVQSVADGCAKGRRTA